MTDQKVKNVTSIPIDGFSNLRITSVWTFLMSVSHTETSVSASLFYLFIHCLFSFRLGNILNDCSLFFYYYHYYVGAVVGALADRVNDVSCRVFVPDGVDLPVLQSPDRPLPANG